MPDAAGRAVLEAELRALARDLDADLGEVDLSGAVIGRLRAASTRTRPRGYSPRRRLAVVVVAAIAATLVAALPAARAAVSRIFEIGAVEVRDEPAPVPRPPEGAALALGDRTTLAEARGRVPVVVPTVAGVTRPDEVWFDDVGGGAVSLVFHPGPGLPAAEHTGVGLLVQEFTGEEEVVRKYLTTDASARPVTIDGNEGVFVSRGEHYLLYADPRGVEVYEAGRLVGNALIFQRGALTIRLEGDLPYDRMVAIAQSLRP